MRRRTSIPPAALTLLWLPLAFGCAGAGASAHPGAGSERSAGAHDEPAAVTKNELTAVARTSLAGTQVEANADVLLDGIGPRVSALPSGDRAQEFMRERLKAYGLSDVRLEPFSLLAWDRRDASLEIVGSASAGGVSGEEGAGATRAAADAPELRILSLGHVDSHDVEAPLIDAGFGTAEEIAALGDAVHGSIVLADVGSPEGYGRFVHRTEKVTLAAEAGAAGFIQVNTNPGPLIPVGVATMGDHAARIPAAAADLATGQRLRAGLEAAADLATGERLRAGLEGSPPRVVVRLRLDNWMERSEASNVLADLTGRTDEVVLVGAHLDSWDLATGALDNGSGTLAVLDIALALAQHASRTGQTPLRTIRFAFWMGEELGLYGSRYHVDRRLDTGELDRYAAVLNMDVVGVPVGLGAMGRPEAAPLLEPVIDAVAAAGIGLEREIATGGGLYSDHQPFLLQGVPILVVRSRAHPDAWSLIHTTEDTRDKLDEPGIGRSAAAAAALLWAVANEPDPGLARWPEPEIGRMLEELGVRDPLERAGEWRW